MKVSGYAAVFNSDSRDLGGFIERIAPGAFADSLRSNRTVFLLHHHDPSDILASTTSGSLRLSEDSYGLRFEATLPDSERGKHLYELARRGDMAKMSFAFKVPTSAGEMWTERSDGKPIRTLVSVNLFEVSTVGVPAYPATRLQARSLPVEATHAAQSTSGRAARDRMFRRWANARLAAA